MIGKHRNIAVQRVKLSELTIGESLGRDLDKIAMYTKLLREHPDADMDPILVHPQPGGYVIENGHHRFIAYLIEGRTHILALVIR
jgi:hypothetical protein